MTIQGGFVVTPIIIAVAILVIISGSAAVFSVQKNNEKEKAALRQELQELQEQQQESAPEQTIKPSPTDLPSPSPTLTNTSKPAVKTATTQVPTVVASAEVPVPQIVVEEYKKALGRDPGLSDIDYWKGLYRENGWSREELYEEILESNERGIAAAEKINNPQNPVSETQDKENILLRDSQCKVVAQQWNDTYVATVDTYFSNDPGFVQAQAAQLYQQHYNECMASK